SGIASQGAADARSAEEGDTWLIRRICRVTAYCDRGTTASGVPSGVGQCAAPADIPFGSKVYIPALDQTFVVTDRTAKRFRHNTVDIFITTRQACLEFGRHYVECAFTIPADPPRYASPRLARAVAHLRS
ncbi:MAG TPA: 3D domain-containing protein, partial [Phycisphaerae bacterium]|nr:3D domain-containing protein [Phycisphaerae bacterium]